ncbi:MAG: DUF5716 family protein [Roseburia sp.]
MEKRKLYLGLDLGTKYALLSYSIPRMEEPDTFSQVNGSEIYQIPMALTKKRGLGQWCYGKEAVEAVERGEGEGCDRLFNRALMGERISIGQEEYEAIELLTLFIKKLLQQLHRLLGGFEISCLTVTLRRLSRDNMQLVWNLTERLEIPRENCRIIDHLESFYYYALNQKQELILHDAVLFDYSETNVFFCRLERDTRTTPQTVEPVEKDYGPLLGNKDIAFYDVAKDALAKKIFSAVYLTGDGFDGDWMKQSLSYLCGGRRVFLGKNLYAKGACYASMIQGQEKLWNYVYIGQHDMKMNLCIKVMDRGEMVFYPLIRAGENCFEAKHSCEILLNGENSIDFWMQPPNSREAKIETLELTDLPNRPPRMSRVRIQAEAVSDQEVRILIRDMGFGELYRSSEKTWNHQMKL